MVLHLRKNEYLSKLSHEILKQIDKYKKLALISSMGTGKSTFFKEELRRYAEQHNFVLVMVNPSVGQIEQIGEDNPHIATICQGKSYYGEGVAVSTPESLYKVMNVLLDRQQKFILVFDEAHEKVASINFRTKFGVVEKYEKYAEKVVYMTATPEPLLNEQFDKVIEVTKEENSLLPCNVLRAERLNTSTKLRHIKKAILNGETVIFINDNKAENQKLKEHLEMELGKESILNIEVAEHQESLFNDEIEIKTNKVKNFDLISSENRNTMAYQSIIKGEYPKGLKVLITTSAIKAGLDIFNPPNTRMIITSVEESFLLVNNVQQMGRLRNKENIKCIDLLIPNIDVPRQYQNGFMPLETITEQLIEQAESHYNTYVKNSTFYPSNHSIETAFLVYDATLERFVIDYNKLRHRAYADYCRLLLIYPNRLKIELERQQAIRLDVTIKNIDAEDNGIIESEVSKVKDDRKKEHNAAKEQILALAPHYQESVIMIPYDEIKLLNDDLRPIAERYHLYMSDGQRKFINQVRRELCNGDKLQAHLKVLKEPKEDIKREFEQIEVIKLNHEYDIAIDKPKAIDATITRHRKKLISKVFFIRRELRDLEKKQGRLSNKRVNQLAQKMIDQEYYKGKKINLEKALTNLYQDLSMIYNIDSQSRISSVKR